MPRRHGSVGFYLAGVACIGLGHAVAVSAELPAAPESELVSRYCLTCHTVTRIERSGGSVTTWEDRLQRMVRWGARIPPTEIAPLATYLARVLPVRARPQPSAVFFANTAVSVAAVQPVQAMLREAAVVDATGNLLTMWLQPSMAGRIKPGFRLRVYSPASRAAVNTAVIVELIPEGGRFRVTARLSATATEIARVYLVELILELGNFLAVPNEAIIERGDGQLVYVRDQDGTFLPKAVQFGLQGDRFTQVLSGLSPGEQVVTLGGFFIDADYRLNAGQ